MTAIDNWIAQLLQYSKTAQGVVEPLNSDIQGVVIPALQSLNTGGNPVFNTVTVQSTVAAALPTAGQGVISGTAANGAVIAGNGSVNDVTIDNKAGTPVLTIPTGTTTVNAAGALAVTGKLSGGGTATNDNASAGQIGEVINSTVLVGSAVALTTGVPANVTSISVTAGDWDIYGIVSFNPAGTTTITQVQGAINTTSATNPTPAQGPNALVNATLTTGAVQIQSVSPFRYSFAVTTTVFLVATSSFGTSTMAAFGYITARRMR